MVDQVRGDRREARRPRLRLTAAGARRALRLAVLAGLGACAYAAPPPGGPPRTTPPRIVRVEPESGAVLTEPPHEAEIVFDEVINEQAAGQGNQGVGQYLNGAVLLSPAPAKVSVGWHRYRISVRPEGGFRPGRIYRLELLPVISDLHNNHLKRGRTVIFSTGPEIPHAALSGTVVDWGGDRAAGGALIRAVLLPDTLPYLALADSGGDFRLDEMPPGEYLVYGVLDQNSNRVLDPREAFDTVRVTLRDSASVALYAFVHDTLPPRIKTVELQDSTTVRITFDHLLDPAQALDSAHVLVALTTDSTTPLALSGVFTPAVFDSTRKAAAARQDSLRRAAREDSLRRAAREDSLRGVTRPPARAAAAPAPVRPPPLTATGRRGRGPAAAPLDTADANRLLRERPAPSDTRVVVLAAPLQPGARYLVRVTGVRTVSGVSGTSESTLPVPAAKPPAAAPADTSHADTSHAGGGKPPAPDRARPRAPRPP